MPHGKNLSVYASKINEDHLVVVADRLDVEFRESSCARGRGVRDDEMQRDRHPVDGATAHESMSAESPNFPVRRAHSRYLFHPASEARGLKCLRTKMQHHHTHISKERKSSHSSYLMSAAFPRPALAGRPNHSSRIWRRGDHQSMGRWRTTATSAPHLRVKPGVPDAHLRLWRQGDAPRATIVALALEQLRSEKEAPRRATTAPQFSPSLDSTKIICARDDDTLIKMLRAVRAQHILEHTVSKCCPPRCALLHGRTRRRNVATDER